MLWTDFMNTGSGSSYHTTPGIREQGSIRQGVSLLIRSFISHRSNGMPDYEKLVDQIVATNADGFNGDTLDGVNKTW